MSSSKVKVKVTVTLKSVKNWENAYFWEFTVTFFEKICSKASKYRIVIVFNKCFKEN